MAKTATTPNKMPLPDSITRMYPRPIDGDSFFTSLASARAYAAGGATAYVGQLLTVVENGVAVIYKIADAAGTLQPLYDQANLPPSTGGGAAGRTLTLTAAQVAALVDGTGYTFGDQGTVSVQALYVNGLMQETSLYAVASNKLTVSLTPDDPEIVAGDSVSILYSTTSE